MNTKLRNVPFSPPDMSEAEIEQVAEALRSGWITTGPKTKDFCIQLGIDKTDKDYNKVESTPSYFLIVCYLNDCWIDTAKWLKSVMRIQICIQKAINESLKTIAEKMKDAQKTFVS